MKMTQVMDAELMALEQRVEAISADGRVEAFDTEME
jgi:hypothetical protein